MTDQHKRQGTVVALSILANAMFAAGFLLALYLAFDVFTGAMSPVKFLPLALLSVALVFCGDAIEGAAARASDDEDAL